MKSCPFCGAEDDDEVTILHIVNRPNGVKSIMCNGCGAVGPKGSNIIIARRNWDYRPEDYMELANEDEEEGAIE